MSAQHVHPKLVTLQLPKSQEEVLPLSQPQQDSPTQTSATSPVTGEVWLLRESFLAYERFHGVFASPELAAASAPPGFHESLEWQPIKRKLPPYMWDELDPFNSDLKRSFCMKIDNSLWIIEPRTVKNNVES